MSDLKLNKLIKLDDYKFYSYLIDRDLFSEKITNNEKIIKISVDEARSLALEFKAKAFDLYDLIKKYEFKFASENTRNVFDIFDLAYFESPNKIVFFENNIKLIDKELGKEENKIFRDIRVKDIIICHEIFHKLEEEYKLSTDNFYISYKALGIFSKKVKLTSPSEIGAMAFSKEFLSLKFNPLILNYLLARGSGKEDIIYNQFMKDNK